ncbi:porin family protein [Phocaeicola salanitronis]|uniref:porin family protein n=1 Tax=Phocaeicola salanitronis TaxID=376805 RepID=UPI0023F9DF21|nr:porin family protein [Phocaeicola salanitronis]
MKKLVLTVLFGMIAMVGFSQVRWNAEFGMTLSNMTKLDDAKALPGFKLGVGMDYAFTDMWSLKSGLFFNSKGYMTKRKGYKTTIRPTYMEIPIMAAINLPITENVKFVVNAGPYIAIGIGGKYKQHWDSGDDGKVFSGDNGVDAMMNRFDLGLQYGVGVELAERYLISLNGQNGFINPFNRDQINKDGDKISPKNMNFAISVGYLF